MLQPKIRWWIFVTMPKRNEANVAGLNGVTFEEKLRGNLTCQVSMVETLLYAAVAVLLILAASLEVVQAGGALWHGISLQPSAKSGLLALDHMLLVLMLIEILHTVRISIRTQHLTMVPFLIVGLIASIRRVLVTTMHVATMAEEGYKATPEQAVAFRYSMIELALASVLILVFVFSIVLLRRQSPKHSGSHEVIAPLTPVVNSALDCAPNKSAPANKTSSNVDGC
jgi:uncharacterized membrane protein (DUF373 family)